MSVEIIVAEIAGATVALAFGAAVHALTKRRNAMLQMQARVASITAPARPVSLVTRCGRQA